jgi:hypothetical protein
VIGCSARIKTVGLAHLLVWLVGEPSERVSQSVGSCQSHEVCASGEPSNQPNQPPLRSLTADSHGLDARTCREERPRL